MEICTPAARLVRDTCIMLARPDTAAAFIPPSSHGLRGDYAAAAADWTVPQAWERYTDKPWVRDAERGFRCAVDLPSGER